MAKIELSKEEKSILNKMFWRSHLVFSSASAIKLQANGVTITMSPAIENIYKDDEEGRIEAYKRTQSFFNTHAVPFNFIMGLTWAMESEHQKAGKVTGEAINSIKAALMGPMAGMFDSLFFNTLRVIAAGIAIGLCSQGNFLGVILFILLYGVPQSILKYFFLKWGYTYGTSLIDIVFNSGLMKSFTKAASIIGLTMVGAMTAQMVYVPLNWVIKSGDTQVVVGEILDSIIPGLASLILLFTLVALIKKGRKPLFLIMLIMVVGIIGSVLGIF
jgi:Phosphotransferase system, mannose/fructose/N-acetylgalactosamine-specific component IID